MVCFILTARLQFCHQWDMLAIIDELEAKAENLRSVYCRLSPMNLLEQSAQATMDGELSAVIGEAILLLAWQILPNSNAWKVSQFIWGIY